jgi:Rieske Fe-S protein
MTMAILAPILVYIIPPPAKGQKKGPQTVRLTKPLTEIGPDEAVQFSAPDGVAFLMADGGGDNAPGDLAFGGYVVKHGESAPTVYAINCPHLGCSYGFDAPNKKFACPCHGSQFRLDGSVLQGPATAPLAHLSWKETEDPSVITVDGLTLGQGA